MYLAMIRSLVVVKGGGSLLTDGEAFRNFAKYCVENNAIPVVSAMKGLTNRFMDMYRDGNSDYKPVLQIYERALNSLPTGLRDAALYELEKDLGLLHIYHDIGAEAPFIGSPEGHSAILLKYYMRSLGQDTEHLTGPDAGFVLDRHGFVDTERSMQDIKNCMSRTLGSGKLVVVGGYLGRDANGGHRVGARNVNDAFAAMLASALGAQRVEIIKDVAGVYPVPPEFGDYNVLERLSYDEAGKMSRGGSPVVHPSAIRIARNGNFPVYVKDMKSIGTVISQITQTTSERPVAALVPDNTFMVSIRDGDMDTPEGRGYFEAVSRFERQHGADIGLVAADTGELSYTVSMGDRKKVNSGAMHEEHNRLLAEHLNALGYRPLVDGQEVGMITVVGDSMQGRPGTFSYLLGVIGKQGISVRAAAQSDEHYAPPSITFVVDAEQLHPSVQALAQELFE